MGDFSFEVVEICEEDETKRLLSPINTATGPRRKRSSNHYRSVSYGSIVPSFTIDVHILRQLLPVKEETKKPEKSESTSDKDDVVKNETVYVESTTDKKPPVKKKHSRVDSLIDTGLPLVSSTSNFTTALDAQLNSLFSFVSFHMSQIDEELRNFEEKQAMLELVNPDAEAESLNSEKTDEMDTVSVGGDSGIEEDHLGSAMGFLTRIKEVCLTMKKTIDTSMQQLDELVGIYDHRMHEDDTPRKLLNSHQSQRADLENRIDECISEIDTKLHNYAKQNDNSNKILELRTLQRAKKERMKCLDVLGFIILLVSSIAIVVFPLYKPSSRWTILLRLLRSPLMIVGYMYFIGFNMMVWARSGINYISIFDFPRKSTPTPSFMFRIGNTFSILFTVMIVVCLITGSQALFVSDKVTGFLMWIAILIFWINPFDMLHRVGRYSFLLVSVRILIAPLVVVLFADFWFADQLNSLLAIMLDIQYLFCYSFTWSSWDSNTVHLKSCTMVSNGIRPIISCLPALWRLLQCLRCYYNTRKVAHLFNAVKYFTTFPVVVFATCFAVRVKPSLKGDWSFEHLNLQRTGWMIVAWMISALFHALYTFYWDVVMDWGLCRVWDGCYVFRSTLLYRKWTYIVAIILDFFIRFACVVKLTLAIVYHMDSDVIYSSLILLEILRRVLWNFFRIEYEQVLRSSTL